MRRRRENFAEKLGTKEELKAFEDYQYFARLHDNAVNQTDTPHISTTREMNALKALGKSNCQNAPHLLSYWEGSMPAGVDKQAMPGGFALIMLMNKLPGESLDYNTFWNKTEETREAIRDAFKVALM